MTTIHLEQINVDSDFVKKELIGVTNLVKDFKTKIENLEMQINKVQSIKANAYDVALLWKYNVLLAMNELRKVVDKLETIVDSTYWPMPTYTNLLFDI
jgi:glutamine synthetase